MSNIGRHNPNIQPNIPEDCDEELDLLFQEIDADRFIRRHRRTTWHGMLDIHHTAYTIPAVIRQSRYDTDNGQASLSVNQDDDPTITIHLHSETSPNQERFLVGHEIGHIALFDYFGRQGAKELKQFTRESRVPDSELHQITEVFCDYFSLRMLGYESTPQPQIDWDSLPVLDVRSHRL